MKTMLIVILSLLAINVFSQSFSGFVETENRYFFQNGLYDSQKDYYSSLTFQLDYSKEVKHSNSFIKYSLFGRYDFIDVNSTHFDIRELYYKKQFKNLHTSLGFKQVFWGVVESTNINDIINQKDMLEGINEETKLGELMWHNIIIKSYGSFETYFMPIHRSVEFPGEKGRLRPPIDSTVSKEKLYEYDLKNMYPSTAIRYTHTIENLDLGVNFFHGLSREPKIKQNQNETSIFYPVINQFGGDFQYNYQALLIKSELIYNINNYGNYSAVVVGFEYTQGNFLRSGGDLGLVCEYLYDERGRSTIRSMDNDLFIGARYSSNNISGTQILIGGIFDLSKSSRIYSLTASSRLNDILKLEIKGNWFNNISSEEFMFLFKNDSYIQVKLIMYIL